MCKKYDDLTNEELKHLKDLFSLTATCNDSLLAAMDRQITMTQDLFEQCVDACLSVHAVQQLKQLMEDYPKFAHALATKTE